MYKSNNIDVIIRQIYDVMVFIIDFVTYCLWICRPAIDTLAATMRRLGSTDFGDEEIGADDVR